LASNRFKAGWLLFAAVVLACCGCGTTINWKFLPRETPRMAAARFQGALLYGPASDSFKSLTEASQGVIGYTAWWLFMPRQKDPETGVKLYEIMANAEVEACYETGENTAEALTYYDEAKQGYSIKLFLEGGDWKVGLVETFFPQKAEEYWQQQRKKHPVEP